MSDNILDHANFLRVLREAAREEVNTDLRYGLQTAADGLDKALAALAENATAANLVEVNGLWAYATRMLGLHKSPRQPNPPIADAKAEASQRKAA